MQTIRISTTRISLAASLALCAAVFAQSLAAEAPTARPEQVGLSSERLERIDELVERHLDAGSFSGAVTLVARNGHIAHLKAHGLMDIESRQPMVEDGIFRIMSMTKPVIGVATLMMMEEGKVRLQDPVSKFIPEWQGMVVAMPRDPSPGFGGSGGG